MVISVSDPLLIPKILLRIALYKDKLVLLIVLFLEFVSVFVLKR